RGCSRPAVLYHTFSNPKSEIRNPKKDEIRTWRLRRRRRRFGFRYSDLHVFALLFDERADALGEQGDVERLLERLAVAVLRQAFGADLVFAGQSDDERRLVLGVAAQVLRDLQALGAAHRQVHDDRVGVEALGLDAGLEAAVGHLVLVIFVLGQQLLQPLDEQRLGADDQDFVPPFFLELAQRHAVLFEEADEVLARDPAVLAAGDAVAAQAAGIEPLADRPGRDLADLRDLAGGKDLLHGRHSITCLAESPPRPRTRDRG